MINDRLINLIYYVLSWWVIFNHLNRRLLKISGFDNRLKFNRFSYHWCFWKNWKVLVDGCLLPKSCMLQVEKCNFDDLHFSFLDDIVKMPTYKFQICRCCLLEDKTWTFIPSNIHMLQRFFLNFQVVKHWDLCMLMIMYSCWSYKMEKI